MGVTSKQRMRFAYRVDDAKVYIMNTISKHGASK